MAQTIIVTAFGLNIPTKLTGLSTLKVKEIEDEYYKDYDPFFNINTKEDLEFAKKLTLKIKDE